MIQHDIVIIGGGPAGLAAAAAAKKSGAEDILILERARLGAERSQVQILLPRFLAYS